MPFAAVHESRRCIDFTRLFSQLVLNVGDCVQWVAFVFPTGGCPSLDTKAC